LGARVRLISTSGERSLSLQDFYTGVRKTVMRPDEMLIDISFPALKANQRGTFIKLGLRRAQAISLVDVALVLTMQADRIEKASITLGSVTPVIVHAVQAENYLVGRTLDEAVIGRAADLAEAAASPIDDVRSPADYRSEMVRICTLRGLRAIKQGQERAAYPENPVLLWGDHYHGEAPRLSESSQHKAGTSIITRINGKEYSFPSGHDKTLLRLLREDAGLTGTKEGCAEGECGACTVFLDGIAVMSCLVPAARANHADIVTVEGLAGDGVLHTVQQAFIDEGAVQCGYCTPGFLMSAAKLLEEKVNPTRDEVRTAITGNLCRCTGYYSIISAIEKAAAGMKAVHGQREGVNA